MQHASDGKTSQQTRQTRESPSAATPARVVSLAAARVRREQRRKQQPPPQSLPELTGLDLRGVDMERMTPSAREHFWFNLNRYARRLYGGACERSAAESAEVYAPITADHIRDAERGRVERARRGEQERFGAMMILDSLQILGAALCGALATKPDLVGEAGVLPLAVALAATVSVFLVRETISARPV